MTGGSGPGGYIEGTPELSRGPLVGRAGPVFFVERRPPPINTPSPTRLFCKTLYLQSMESLLTNTSAETEGFRARDLRLHIPNFACGDFDCFDSSRVDDLVSKYPVVVTVYCANYIL